MRELCLDARDKFMPFEICNLIVYFLWFHGYSIFSVHKSLPEEIATFPLNVAVRKQQFCKCLFFFSLCVWEEWQINSWTWFVGKKDNFQSNWIINYCFEEYTTWNNVDDLDKLWTPVAKDLWRWFWHLKKDMQNFMGSAWNTAYQLDVGKEH